MKLRHLYTACLLLLLLLSGCSGHGPCPADRALYTADSLDARHMPIAPDTLLNAAIAHYESRCFVPRDKLARACYYRGRINRASQNYPQAMADFAQARRHFTRRTPPTLQGRTAANIAFLCTSAGSDSLALFYYNEALEHFRSAKDTSRMAYTLLDIGGVKLRTGKAEESLNYYRQTVPFAKDSMLYGNVLQCIGKAYYELNEPDSALHYMMRSVPYPYKNNVMGVRYLYIAYCHFDAQQLDSAAVYAQKAIDATTDPNIHNSAYYMLMDWAKRKNDLDVYDLYSHKRADAMQLITDRHKILTEAVSTIPLEISKRETIHLKKRQYLLLLVFVCCMAIACLLWCRARKESRLDRIRFEKEKERQRQEHELQLWREQQQNIRRQKEWQQNRQAEEQREKQERLMFFSNQVDVRNPQLWKNWEQLEKEANIYLNGFFRHLEEAYPKINEQDKRLCLLILLGNYSYEEISERINRAPGSIGKLKNRLADKIGCSSREMGQYLLRFVG